MLSLPITMGANGSPIDWTEFDKRAMAALGKRLPRYERLDRQQLAALGFVVAAAASI